MYVIWNHERKMFVSKPGSEKSYTKKLEEAAVYLSESKCRQNCCGNEAPRDIRLLMMNNIVD